MRTALVRLGTALTLLGIALPCSGATIAVNFVTALQEIIGPVSLPILLSGGPNNIRLRYEVPLAASIGKLNSVKYSIELYDDDDTQANENGNVGFVLQGIGQPNFGLELNGGLNGYTFASPLAISGSIDPTHFSQVLAEIQNDGFFLLRVNRDGGDFYVKTGTVTIDAELIPEPASLLMVATALGLIAGGPRIRRQLRR